jgi:peptide deformylase
MKILTYPDLVLSRKTMVVRVVNKKIRQLSEKMLELMYKHNGVGLAANQIGISLCILVANPTKKPSDELVLINPQIIKTSKETSEEKESCLSIPGISAQVRRYVMLTCQGVNPKGKRVKYEFSNLLARVVQHEIDHLNGILFIDRISEDKKKSLLEKYFQWTGRQK